MQSWASEKQRNLVSGSNPQTESAEQTRRYKSCSHHLPSSSLCIISVSLNYDFILVVIGGVTNFFVDNGRLSKKWGVHFLKILAVWTVVIYGLCKLSTSKMLEQAFINSLSIISQIFDVHSSSNIDWDCSNVDMTAWSWYWRMWLYNEFCAQSYRTLQHRNH